VKGGLAAPQKWFVPTDVWEKKCEQVRTARRGGDQEDRSDEGSPCSWKKGELGGEIAYFEDERKLQERGKCKTKLKKGAQARLRVKV